MKIAFILRSLDLAFAVSTNENYFPIVGKGTDEEKFALQYFPTKNIIALKIENSTNFSLLDTESIVKFTNLKKQLKNKKVNQFLIKQQNKSLLSWAKDNSVNLLCVPHELREKFEDKIFFDNFLNKYNLPSPKSKILTSLKSKNSFHKSVIQVPSSTGGEGTFVAYSEADFKKITKNLGFPLLLREHINGLSLGTSIFIKNNKIYLTGLEKQCFSKNKSNNLGFFIGIQWMPYHYFKPSVYRNIENALVQIGTDLNKEGLGGLINIEFILDKNGLLYFIECNPRIACSTNQIIANKELTNNVDFAKLYSQYHNSPNKKNTSFLKKFYNTLPKSKFEGSQIIFTLGQNTNYPVRIINIFPSGFYDISGKDIVLVKLASRHDFISKKNVILYYNETNIGETYHEDVQIATVLSNVALYDFKTGDFNALGKKIYNHFKHNQ